MEPVAFFNAIARFLMRSRDIFAVAVMDILVVRLSVDQRGVNFAVAEETLDLFNRHAGADGRCGNRVAEQMRMHIDLNGCPG